MSLKDSGPRALKIVQGLPPNFLKIVQGLPPNFDDIVKVFPNATAKGVVFTYGKTLYNPSGGVVSKPLLAHEEAHSQRQGEDAAGWWKKYMNGPDFYLFEEIIGHRAEYQKICELTQDREVRFQALRHIAGRLSSSLYNKAITPAQAKKEILNAPQ